MKEHPRHCDKWKHKTDGVVDSGSKPKTLWVYVNQNQKEDDVVGNDSKGTTENKMRK